MDGFLIIDKPVGMTSHDVVNRVRRITGQKKAGHTGTLDPFATGVLPVAVGEGTKAIQFLDEAVKEYQATLVFGRATDTQDCTGTTISEGDWQHLTKPDIVKLAEKFTGKLQQQPPMFSALKHQGVPLYKLARQGLNIERKSRDIEIFSLVIENIDLPEITFTVRCSRGTYVRTLANDMGEQAGCGAHLIKLRRNMSGPFVIADAVSLDHLAELSETGRVAEAVVSPLKALSHLRELHLTAEGGALLRNGVAPANCHLLKDSDELIAGAQVKLVSMGKLAAVAEINKTTNPEAGLNMRLLRVFN